jgi:hypothetical protein
MTIKTAVAQFGNRSSRYSYLVPVGDEPKVGDMIVTSVAWGNPDEQEDVNWSSPSTARDFADNCRVATIVEVSDGADRRASKFYLHLIPRQSLLDRHEENKKALQRERDRQEARKKLDKLLENEGRLQLYRQLAAVNAEAAELLKVVQGA